MDKCLKCVIRLYGDFIKTVKYKKWRPIIIISCFSLIPRVWVMANHALYKNKSKPLRPATRPYRWQEILTENIKVGSTLFYSKTSNCICLIEWLIILQYACTSWELSYFHEELFFRHYLQHYSWTKRTTEIVPVSSSVRLLLIYIAVRSIYKM